MGPTGRRRCGLKKKHLCSGVSRADNTGKNLFPPAISLQPSCLFNTPMLAGGDPSVPDSLPRLQETTTLPASLRRPRWQGFEQGVLARGSSAVEGAGPWALVLLPVTGLATSMLEVVNVNFRLANLQTIGVRVNSETRLHWQRGAEADKLRARRASATQPPSVRIDVASSDVKIDRTRGMQEVVDVEVHEGEEGARVVADEPTAEPVGG